VSDKNVSDKNVSDKPVGKVHHLRPLPSPGAAEGDRLSALERKVSETLHHFEGRLEAALKQAQPGLQSELQTQLRQIESRIRKELSDFGPTLSAAARRGQQGDLADEINSALHAIEHRLSDTDYRKRLRALRLRFRAIEVDEYGFDPIFAEQFKGLFDFLFYKYFRVSAEGIRHVPREGRALLVANHSGTLPYDGLMLSVAMRNEHPQRRVVRALAEDFVFHFPYLGVFVNRLGHVRACQENAERMLGEDRLVAVFPEGIKGIGKLYRNRYQLQRFGRGGFIRLALRTGAPIIPVAIVGAEEIHPMLAKLTWLVKDMGIPYLPITPTFPWLGPLGAIPLPAKWTMVFGEPIDLTKYGPDAVNDRLLINRLSEQVRQTIQDMVRGVLKNRRSVWFG
jgi:1-acyl-sn-glycerol-3-phosphate acyltransferase